MVLRSRAATYAKLEAPKLAAPSCPHCEGEQVSPLDATAHVVRCQRHPARVRYEQLSRVAAVLCARRGIRDELEVQPPFTFALRVRDDDFIRSVRFEEALACLGRQGLTEQRKDAAWSIRNDLSWRMHVAESDPCAWCAGVCPLEAFTAHLWSCDRQPGFLRASVLADALTERFGEEALLAAVNEDREQLARQYLDGLISACRVYSGHSAAAPLVSPA